MENECRFVLHSCFMALPFFYIESVTGASVVLNEDTSKHVVQVLRMQNGEWLQLTDGNGNLFTCEITDNNRKRCVVSVNQTVNTQPKTAIVSIAISLLKNSSRFEWFLEKATEIGISEIIPIICARTEKSAFKYERMNSILISAMLQSQQSCLPLLHHPVKFTEAVINATQQQKFIAHCEEGLNKVQLYDQISTSSNQLILIGPEGDFTTEEIAMALQNNFEPVALGNTRLRTETAGMVAATLLRLR
jgi:16S rRNA (uracil1498-N3)-methyltransferase